MVALFVAAVVILVPSTAWAYIGPGAGLGLIGSLIAVVATVLVALFGVVLFPIMMLRKRRKNKAHAIASQDAENRD